jgi:hypothetical protein
VAETDEAEAEQGRRSAFGRDDDSIQGERTGELRKISIPFPGS